MTELSKEKPLGRQDLACHTPSVASFLPWIHARVQGWSSRPRRATAGVGQYGQVQGRRS